MTCPCDKTKCQTTWEGICPPDASTDDDEGLRHCEVEGCHDIYWGFKDGVICVECGIHACQRCMCDTGYSDQMDEEWYCTPCAVELKLEKVKPTIKEEKNPCPCSKQECIDEWRESKNSKSLSHCQTDGCHSIYWGFKNGGCCANIECGAKACEGCMDEGFRYEDSEEEDWYCEKCKPNVKAIVKKGKARRNASQFQYIMNTYKRTHRDDSTTCNKRVKTNDK